MSDQEQVHVVTDLPAEKAEKKYNALVKKFAKKAAVATALVAAGAVLVSVKTKASTSSTSPEETGNPYHAPKADIA